ncbi:MAG: hypothetical protein H0T50_02155 [Gemmatimonadales bacterium]|nr:hypothetical protein [Gemmatimonadales bacterium]
MPTIESDISIDPAGRFEYFMLRVVRREQSSPSIAGQVERLGTGEKRRFESGRELLALVTGWPAATFGGG